MSVALVSCLQRTGDDAAVRDLGVRLGEQLMSEDAGAATDAIGALAMLERNQIPDSLFDTVSGYIRFARRYHARYLIKWLWVMALNDKLTEADYECCLKVLEDVGHLLGRNYETDDDQSSDIIYESFVLFTEDRREFLPETNGFDTFFIQWTGSWGQLWTKKQWSDFKQWYGIHHDDLKEFFIPQFVKNWKNSWKKYNIAYLSDSNKYYVYPTKSFTTMVPSLGTHIKNVNLRNPFLVPLCSSFPRQIVFQDIDSAQKYDSFFELCDRPLEINGKDEVVSYNIYCNKRKRDLKGKYYVTSIKIAGREPVKAWGRQLLPPEKNIIDSLCGDGLYLYKTQDYESTSLSTEDKRRFNFELSVAELLLLASSQVIKRVKEAFGIRCMGVDKK